MSETKREAFLDGLRVTAICAVVFLHTLTGIMDHVDMSQYPKEDRLFLILMDLVCWAVPVFLMISGYLFLRPSAEMTLSKVVTRYCRRILLALFLFGVPYACLELIAGERTFRIGMIARGFLMVLRGDTWSHMWYLYLILVLYLFTPLMRFLLERLPGFICYGTVLVLFIMSSVMPYLGRLGVINEKWVVPEDGIYLFYFLCGYLFCKKDEKKKEEKMIARNKALLWGAVTVLSIVISVTGRVSGVILFRTAYGYPPTVGIALGLFGIGLFGSRAGLWKTKKTGFLEKTAKLCFTVYLVHPVFLNIYYKFLRLSPLDYAVWWSLPAFYLGILLPSVLTALILYRIKLLQKYVL